MKYSEEGAAFVFGADFKMHFFAFKVNLVNYSTLYSCWCDLALTVVLKKILHRPN